MPTGFQKNANIVELLLTLNKSWESSKLIQVFLLGFWPCYIYICTKINTIILNMLNLS